MGGRAENPVLKRGPLPSKKKAGLRGITPSQAGDILEGEYKPAFIPKHFNFGGGIMGALRGAAARIFDPVTQEWSENSQLPHATQDVLTEFSRRHQRLEDHVGVKLLDELEKKVNQSPGAIGAIAREYEGKSLSPEQSKFLKENRQLVDEYIQKVSPILEEAGRRGYSDRVISTKYYPHDTNYIGRAIAEANSRGLDVNPENLRDLNRNLERERTAPDHYGGNDVRALRSYLRQLADRETVRPFDEWMRHRYIKSLGRVEAGHVDSWRRNNLLGQRNWADLSLYAKQLEALQSREYVDGQSFVSKGNVGYEGKITVNSTEAGRVEHGPQAGEALYDITVERPDGTDFKTQATKWELLGMEYSDKLLDKAPVTRKLWAAHRLTSDLFVLGNLRSAVHHGISGGSKLLTSGLSNEALAYGAKSASRWLSGAMESAEIARRERLGILDKHMRDVTEVEGYRPGFVRKVGYAPLEIPANFYRNWAFSAFEVDLAKQHPNWTPKQVEVAASLRASQVATIASNAARSPLSYNPLVKMITFMQNSALKDITKAVSDAQQGKMGRAIAQLGITTGTILALHAAAGEKPEEMLEAAKHLIPFSALLTGEGYSFPVTGAASKLKSLAKWVGDQTGLLPNDRASLEAALPVMVKTLDQLSHGDLYNALVPATRDRK